MTIGALKFALYTEQKTTGKKQLIDVHKVANVLPARKIDLQGEDLAASSKPLVGILYRTWHAGLGARNIQQCAMEAQAHNKKCPTC